MFRQNLKEKLAEFRRKYLFLSHNVQTKRIRINIFKYIPRNLSISQCSDKTNCYFVICIVYFCLSISQCSDKTCVKKSKIFFLCHFLSHNVQTKLTTSQYGIKIIFPNFLSHNVQTKLGWEVDVYVRKDTFYLTMFRQNTFSNSIS